MLCYVCEYEIESDEPSEDIVVWSRLTNTERIGIVHKICPCSLPFSLDSKPETD